MDDDNKPSGVSSNKKLGVVPLTALVVGAIIGSGIFSLPQNMAENAGAGAILIAWIVTFIGMFALTKTFEWLSLNRQDIDDGVYGYARKGFGNYMGFNSAWGYWISIWVGCGAGYMVIFFATLGSFEALSFFGDGSTLPALAGEVMIIWMVHFFVLRGVQSAAVLNTIITIAKILPILIFIFFASMAFQIDTFNVDFWGEPKLGSVLNQIRSTMLFTVWMFLGIECATVYNTRAKDAVSVSRATSYGFLLTFVLLASVSVLSLGVVPQDELAVMKNPSMAGVMAAIAGPWGGVFIKVGVLVSLSGALLAWTLISTEMLYLSGRGKDHTSPQVLGQLNFVGAPAAALWLTNILVTLLLVYNHFNASGYNNLIQLGSSMALIPYWLCAAFALKTVIKLPFNQNRFITVFAVISAIYSTWLIFSGGWKFLFLSMVFYAPGLLFFIWACREKKTAISAIFPTIYSKAAVVVIVGLGIRALYLLITGELKL